MLRLGSVPSRYSMMASRLAPSVPAFWIYNYTFNSGYHPSLYSKYCVKICQFLIHFIVRINFCLPLLIGISALSLSVSLDWTFQYIPLRLQVLRYSVEVYIDCPYLIDQVIRLMLGSFLSVLGTFSVHRPSSMIDRSPPSPRLVNRHVK